MAAIKHQIEKETFVPEKNYFKTEWVSIQRDETEYELISEAEIDRWSRRGFISLCVGVIAGFAMLLIFGILGSINSWFYVGCGAGAAVLLGGIMLTHGWFWEKEKELCEAYNIWYKEHENELWAEASAEVKAYNEEQHRIAEVWRASHILEEKIRACIKDPLSSVDIANLARYYAEFYLKERQNEELG